MYSVFYLFAFSLGGLLSRLPDLQEELGVSETQLGLTLIGMAAGSLISLTFASPVIDRYGARATAFVTVFGTAAMYALIPWLPSALMVFAAFFVAGILAGALEINVNLETDKLEAQLGRRIMNRAHGMWSLGFFLTAIVGAVVRQAGISVEIHTAAMLALVVVVGFVTLTGMTTTPKRPDAHAGETPKFALPTIGLMPLCLIGIAAFLAESSGVDWSAIYMRDVFAVEPFVGGLGLGFFTFFMAVTRLTVDPFVDRHGPRRIAAVLLCVAMVGLLLVGFAPHPYVALAGFGLMGTGCSAIYPLAVSAAAQRTDRPASVNVAAIGQVTFVVFFAAPPVIGFIAEHWGIRNSFLAILPFIVVGLALVRALPARQPKDAPDTEIVPSSAHA
jgi:MFS family permease